MMNIEQRILNLENKIRMQRTALVALVSTIGVSMLMGLSQDTKSEDATFKNVIASSITIVDKDGKHVIAISSGSEEEGPGIAIMDGGSIPRIAIGINPEDNGGGIAFMDTKSNPLIAVGTNEKGEAGIAFMDTKSNPRIAMGTNEKGEAGIELFGAGLSAPLEGKTWPTQ